MGVHSRRMMLATGATAAMWLVANSPAAAALQCKDLTAETLGMEGITIQTSESIVPDDRLAGGHCLVEAKTAERTGIDNQPYAISFELRMPDDWNGRFFHQLNGTVGEIIPAVGLMLGGDISRKALDLGYAVLSSDGGHDRGRRHDDGLLIAAGLFGLDPQARSYHGYMSLQTLSPIAKKLIATYYDRPVEHSYAVGCSIGGRSAILAAALQPDEYDGILAGAPGLDMPRAALQHPLDVQTFAALAGDLASAFSPADLTLVADGIRATCDKLDGVEDGMVLDTRACQATFDITTLQCGPESGQPCLSPQQVAALQKVHAGPKDKNGTSLYSDWLWDVGIGASYWRLWKLESEVSIWGRMPVIVIAGAPALAYVYSTPPTQLESTPAALEKFLLDFDLDRDAAKIDATDGPFKESATDFMTPPGVRDPELHTFKASGGKMLIFHGTSDPMFSEKATERWYARLAEKNGGSAADFAKYYPVPGMTHCAGGPATDDLSFFDTLVEWVEAGVEPHAVTAAVRPNNEDIPPEWSKERTRPLCPWPQVARYRDGDIEKAESFACAQ